MSRLSLTLALAAFVLCTSSLAQQPPQPSQSQPPRPNILWLTSEDNGPHLGCYGDAYATTPNLDALAARGMLYVRCWSNAPVCAPARTAVITGVYPTSTGSEHMRSQVRMPPGMKMFPQFLREAGYYCTNNSKEDYNLEKPGKVWDESSPRAHWKNRKAGQPFFAVFNYGNTHESQIRKRPHKAVHDPAKVTLPPYHPDTPEVRQDWAQYYDKLTEVDALAGKALSELEAAGLADDTIVFYYGDHGPGLPRGKRSACDSGLRVPLIVHVPEKFRKLAPKDYAPGERSPRLVQFVDLAPTLLSLIGQEAPEWMQGRAFMGEHEAEPNQYLHGFRGRMDERLDMVRSVTDGRYVYVRNYMPHLPHGQHNDYMFQTATTRVWKRLYDEGKLTPAQAAYWQAPRAAEELYDLASDPHEVANLATSAQHRPVLEKLRRVQHDHAVAVRDRGFLPEGEIHTRRDVPADVLERIIGAASGGGSPERTKQLSDADSAVRYWAATALLASGEDGVRAAGEGLTHLLGDESPYVRIVAAEAVGRHGPPDAAARAVGALLDLADVKRHGVYVAVPALNALDALDERAAPVRDKIAALPESDEKVIAKMKEYVPRLKEAILRDLPKP